MTKDQKSPVISNKKEGLGIKLVIPTENLEGSNEMSKKIQRMKTGYRKM